MSSSSKQASSTVEVTKSADRRVHGTHDYPDPLTAIEQTAWDVVIVGAGPAGLMLAASLARFGGHQVLVVDERSEPTTAGRADGIQPRTIEVLKNMQPLGSELFAKSAASYERTFWDPRADGQRGIERSRRVQSFPTTMEIEDNCTLGLQQGLIEGGFLRDMERHGQRVTRPWAFRDFAMTSASDYPVQVTLEKMMPVQDTVNQGGAPVYTIQPTGEFKTIKTRYLVGCDGGRSKVRSVMEQRHNVEMKGDWVDTLWAALDCVVETDFPDVRKIAAIHSKNHGALYIFPRERNNEGDSIIRCYTQVNRLEGQKSKLTALEARDKVTSEMVQKAIQEIAFPYTFKFKTVEWFTCYPIGQRLVSHYALPAGKLADGRMFEGQRVFLAGDACHTHSPKAGQGMNTAIIDAQALAWRINLVEKGLADRQTLLSTYHEERHATGRRLIEFDAEYAALFSGEIPKGQPELSRMTEEQRKQHFINVQRRNAGFTTGAGVFYADNVLNHRNTIHLQAKPRAQRRAESKLALEAGWRLTPAWATRFISSAPVRMIHEVQFTAPGGFRIYVCAGDLNTRSTSTGLVRTLARHLESSQSFLHRYRANGKAFRLRHGTYHDVPDVLNSGLPTGYSHEANPFFHLLLIVKRNRFTLELGDVKELGPMRSMIYCDDVEAGGQRLSDLDGDESVGGLHRKWGLPDGGIVVCRPDGYVGCVLALDDIDALERYFAGFLVPASPSTASSTSASRSNALSPRQLEARL